MKFHIFRATGVGLTVLTLAPVIAVGAGPFLDLPSHQFPVSLEAFSVVLGDVNGDGDLDVLLGNRTTVFIFLNSAGRFADTPDHTVGPLPSLGQMALGDLDGDGDLDLCVGAEHGTGGGMSVYSNDGTGSFGPSPTQSVGDDARPAFVLADVDNDHDLDVVFTVARPETAQTIIFVGGVEIYPNENGTFGSLRWESPRGITNAVDVGDVDGDGDLDLVLGNSISTVTPGSHLLELYLNDGTGGYGTVPVWFSDWMPYGKAFDVKLCDADGDGDLDLVATDSDYYTVAFENLGAALGYFSSTEVWSNYGSWGLTLGDVDSDGKIDMEDFHGLLIAGDGISWAYSTWRPDILYGCGDRAFGDLDGDGTLDLVLACNAEPSAIYFNQTGRGPDAFGASPTWTTSPPDYFLLSRLGDLNGDGILDLVAARDGDLDLYVGENGSFSTTPTLVEHYSSSPNVLVLADIDRDSNCDIAFATGAGIDIDLFEQGRLGSQQRLPLNAVHSLALGDVDGDGYLDLACGNSDTTSVYLFLPSVHGFSSEPVWSVPIWCGPLVIGDIDGDGELDLGWGGESDGDRWYRNVGGTFELLSSGVGSSNTSQIELGDIDSDGDLDEVLARNYDSLSLRFNGGGNPPFRQAVDWTVQGYSGFALADKDGDGDLDIFMPSAVYVNRGGTIVQRQNFLQFPNFGLQCVADVDADGDNDWFTGVDLLSNVRLPVYKGEPTAPTRQLPNNGSFVRNVRVLSNPQSGDNISIFFSTVDVESDPMRLVVDYHFEGDSTWSAPIAATQVMTSSPAGVGHSITWDANAIPFDPRNVELRFRTVELPMRVSTIQHASPYIKFVGRVVPHRSNAIVEGKFDFPSVTAGDTVATTIALRNTGNRPLIVSSTVMPEPFMRLTSPSLPDTVAPGDTSAVVIESAPTAQNLAFSGVVKFSTNDAAHPIVDVPVSGYSIPLLVESHVVSTTDSVPLGEALTVVVAPTNGSRIESGRLYYRSHGAIGFQTTKLAVLGSQLVGVIPGEGVSERGIEYYAEVENSGVLGHDPPNAPNQVHFVPVRVPELVSTTARPTSGSDYLDAREIEVQVVLPRGSEFESGLLHYRRGGESSFEIDTLMAGPVFPAGVVNESFVGARGVEYWVEVQTATQTLTDPPVDPGANPRHVQVTLPSVRETWVHAGERYRMVSFPLSFDPSFSGTIEDLLVDEKGMGEYDQARWRSWVWMTDKKSYGELNNATLADRFRPAPGRAWWLVTKQNHQVDTGPVVGKSTPTDRPYEIVLQPGWSMIGNPFAFSVAWSSVMVDGARADQDSLVSGPFGYSGSYQKKDRLDPFLGYWVNNDHATAITLQVPPTEAVTSAAAATVASATGDKNDWIVRVEAESNDARDDAEVGVAAFARDGLDRLDDLDPPMSPGDAVSVYAIADRRRSRDMRDAASWRHDGGVAWALDVGKNFTHDRAGDDVTLTFDMGAVPTDQRVVLLDRKLGREVDLRGTPVYTVLLGDRATVAKPEDARFLLVVGSDEYLNTERSSMPGLPPTTALYQNTPNPFNPSTVIRYDLAAPAEVGLRIYDLRGALVKNLETGKKPAGRYEVGWNGVNERGQRVASGMYFYELRAGAFRQTKKMLLLK